MSFFQNMFGSAANANQQQQQQQQQSAVPQDNNNSNVQNPDVKNADPAKFPPNPLDAYAALFDNKNKTQEAAPPSFTLDPTKLHEVGAKMNFADGIDPEMMQKAVQGDVQSFLQVINQVGRNAYVNSLQHTGVLTDKFVGARSEYDRGVVKKEVSSQLINQAIQVPNADHPVVRQELKRIAEMFHAQSPDAAPAEIAAKAQEYFMTVFGAVGNQQPSSTQPKQTDKAVDWDAWFDNSK